MDHLHIGKNFVAILCGQNCLFKMHLWDRSLPHAIITLNLLISPCLNPNLLAYVQIQWYFDYKQTPLFPPSTKVVTYVTLEIREP